MVFSLGILLAELLTGMTPVMTAEKNPRQVILLSSVIVDNIPFVPTGSIAQEVYRSSLLDSHILLDPFTRKTWPKGSWERLGYLVRRCVDPAAARRPLLSEVGDEMRKILEEPHHRCGVCSRPNQPNVRLRCGHDILCPLCIKQCILGGSGCPLCLAPVIQVL